MKRMLSWLGMTLVGSLVAPALAGAAIPSAATSSVAAHVVVCPAGDSMLVVVVHDVAGNPWSDDPIWVETCDCPGLRLSATPPPCSAPDGSPCHVVMIPDPYGVVEIPISGGGLCPGGSVRVVAGGVVLAVRPEPACFDQNGDLKVDSADAAIVQSKIGTSDPGADFDGDGAVTAQDVTILQAHLGHSSPDATPAATGRSPASPR